jgi:hypothetical protein
LELQDVAQRQTAYRVCDQRLHDQNALHVSEARPTASRESPRQLKRRELRTAQGEVESTSRRKNVGNLPAPKS